jgi:hypothetical protein
MDAKSGWCDAIFVHILVSNTSPLTGLDDLVEQRSSSVQYCNTYNTTAYCDQYNTDIAPTLHQYCKHMFDSGHHHRYDTKDLHIGSLPISSWVSLNLIAEQENVD